MAIESEKHYTAVSNKKVFDYFFYKNFSILSLVIYSHVTTKKFVGEEEANCGSIFTKHYKVDAFNA